MVIYKLGILSLKQVHKSLITYYFVEDNSLKGLTMIITGLVDLHDTNATLEKLSMILMIFTCYSGELARLYSSLEESRIKAIQKHLVRNKYCMDQSEVKYSSAVMASVRQSVQ